MPLLIHCTQKLLAEIPDSLIDAAATGESWHANLLLMERRKCVLFTHDATLYSVFVPGLRMERITENEIEKFAIAPDSENPEREPLSSARRAVSTSGLVSLAHHPEKCYIFSGSIAALY